MLEKKDFSYLIFVIDFASKVITSLSEFLTFSGSGAAIVTGRNKWTIFSGNHSFFTHLLSNIR